MTQHYLSFLPIKWPHNVSKPFCTWCPFFLHPSCDVRTLMSTLPVEVTMPYPHFLIFLFFIYNGLGFLMIWPCHTQGVHKCNLTLDTMYTCIDYRERACYAQLCLLWIPGNPSLCIPKPPVFLYFSDIRFTTWTYSPFFLPDLWFNACSVLLNTMFRSHNSKIINIYLTQIWVFQPLVKLMGWIKCTKTGSWRSKSPHIHWSSSLMQI